MERQRHYYKIIIKTRHELGNDNQGFALEKVEFIIPSPTSRNCRDRSMNRKDKTVIALAGMHI
jgi:hypothetical protein